MRTGTFDWSTIVTAAVAVYGAILSTYNALSRWKENRRKVSVTLELRFLPPDPDDPPPQLYLSALNQGKPPTFLKDYGLRLPSKEKIDDLTYMGNSATEPLMEGNSCTYSVSAGEVALALHARGISGNVRLVAFFEDALGTSYYSKPLSFEIEQCLQA